MSRSGRRIYWSEIARYAAPALRLSRGDWLARVRSTEDFVRLARRRTPRAVFDYVDGGAERELTLCGQTEAFDRRTFHPHVMRDVREVDPSATVLGRRLPIPVVLAPTGFTRMMHRAGESAVARAAAAAGLPYTLSTMSTTSVENLPADGDRWLQLYLWQDREASRRLLDRAHASGFSTLVVTVDTPVTGARLRDVRNGLTIPPTLTRRTLAGMTRKPRWLFDAATTEPLAFEALGTSADTLALISAMFNPGVTPRDLEWLRTVWDGPVVVKGILRADDARLAVAAGADGVAVSYHGGRQLDRSAAPLDVLPEIVDAVGSRATVFLDGGVRSGADIAMALAIGADAVFLARPYLYALMAAGERGVAHLLALLREDYVRTLRLLGATGSADLDRDLVRDCGAQGRSAEGASR